MEQIPQRRPDLVETICIGSTICIWVLRGVEIQPIVYFEKRFHEQWSYVIGAPKTALKYHFDEKHQ